MTCPLCNEASEVTLLIAAGRRAACCRVCGLVFTHIDDKLSASAEKTRYEQHNNSRQDERFVEFLGALTRPFQRALAAGARVLDYGSGPEPVLAILLSESGYEVTIYDPYFADQKEALTGTYDGIVCCETAEHFNQPFAEWSKLAKLLAPGGILGVMTLLLRPETDIATWWYAKDPTHVVFYSDRTIDWIAGRFEFEIIERTERVILFRKKRDSM